MEYFWIELQNQIKGRDNLGINKCVTRKDSDKNKNEVNF